MATFAGNPAAAALDGTEVVPVTQAAVDKRTTAGAIAALATATTAAYDPTASGLSATTVQEAIDELAAAGGGGASIGVQYEADTGSTSDSDPGTGLLKWNNATQASATVLFLDDTTTDGVSLTGWWSALDSGGFCYLQHATDQDTWQIWEIGTITDASGYVKLVVTLLADGGAFADGDPMLVTLQQGPTAGTVTSVNGDTGTVVLTEGKVLGTITTYTASQTSVLADEVVQMNVASANNFTIPPNSSVAIPVGSFREVWQVGAGQTTIVAGVGVTILYAATYTLKLKEQNSGCSLRKVATDTWRLTGDMEPV